MPVVRTILAEVREQHQTLLFSATLQGDVHRLIKDHQLFGYRYDRFWVMDTFKEQQQLSDLYDSGCAPWEVWNRSHNGQRVPC